MNCDYCGYPMRTKFKFILNGKTYVTHKGCSNYMGGKVAAKEEKKDGKDSKALGQ